MPLKGGIKECALVVMLLLGAAAHAQLAPVAGTHYAGRASDTGYAGAVNSQGAYGASVPLDLPAVRGNLPVPVQVAYGGNRVGAAGLGWDIPLSFIFRESTLAHRRPVPQATFSASVPGLLQANEQLSLTLSGGRVDLIRNSANTAWIPRRGSQQLEVRGVGDELHLYDGEGRTYVFSRQGPSGTLLVSGNLYLLAEIRGSGGSRVKLDYQFSSPTVPGGGTGLSIELTQVSYNPHLTTAQCFKHGVVFTYDTPADPVPVLSMSMLGGTVLARTRKLDKVGVFSKASCSEAATELRTYHFTYQPDVDLQLPRLQSVTMSGQSGTPERNVTLPVATYAYGAIHHPDRMIRYESKSIEMPAGHTNHGAFGVSYTSGQFSPEPHGASDELVDLFGDQMLVDINGDGRTDFKGDGGWRLNVPGPNGGTEFQQVEGGGFPLDARDKIHSAFLDVNTNMPARVNTVVNDTLKQLIDMNGDGRLDIVETVLPDTNNWLIHLNKPNPSNPKLIEVVTITVPVTRMRQALGTTGLSFGRVAMARRTTVPENFAVGSAGNKRKRTITEFELKDVNGDGYPDFVFNRSIVRRSDPQGRDGDMIGGRGVQVMYNTAGAHLANGVHLFASPRTLVDETVSGCGISRWEADPSSVSGGLLNQVCGLEDINGDGVLDRIDSVIENGQVVAQAALGTGVSTAPFATNARIRLPGALTRTETALTLTNGIYVPTNCVAPNLRPTFDIRRTRALRDINGDGIPDYIAGQLEQSDVGVWTVALGTGVGFTAPSSVAGTLEPSRELSSCGSANSGGQVSATVNGLYDIDGDGQPEVLALLRVPPVIIGLAPTTVPVWRLAQLQPPPASGPVIGNSVPAAGRLIRIDNGYGASTHITYRSAKEDVFGRHNVPFHEIVVAEVTTRDLSGVQLLSSVKYAYGGSSLVFDSVSDAFVFPGYDRSLQLVGTDPAQPDNGVATITDLYRLAPFTAAQFPNATARFKRYQQAGRVSDVTQLVGTLGTDPWVLLNTNISNDYRRRSGARYTYDVRLLPSGVAPNGNEVCLDMMFPYDFASSQANSLANDQCTQVGFAFQQDVRSWRGMPLTATDPIAATSTVKTRFEVQAVDTLGRATQIANHNDSTRPDDDLCTRISYATPTGTDERVLSALATRTVTAGNCSANPEITLASESWEYDTSAAGVKLPAGQVAAGFVTSRVVSRRRTDDGTRIPDASGNSDIRLFDAIYDAQGNPKTITTRREDGAVSVVTATFDSFGLAPASAKVAATNEDGNALPPLVTTFGVDPITLALLSITDPNGAQAGNTFDGFGRVLLSTVKPSGGSTVGALSSLSYLGFASHEHRNRSIVQKVFDDPVPPANVATAPGRIGTVFLDRLGREVRTEVQMGIDYSNEIMHVGRRTFDLLGRVAFEADPFPNSQNFATAYGTSYHFNLDGTASCVIRGRGPQVLSQVTNEAEERYPTCFARAFDSDSEFVTTRDALALLDASIPTASYHARYTAIGRLINRSTVNFDPVPDEGVGRSTVTDSVSFAHDPFGHLIQMIRHGNPDAAAQPVSTEWKYDSFGQVLELIEPNSATQYRSYDNWGALTLTRWTDTTTSPPNDRRIVQRYDALGRLLHAEERTNNVVDAETVNDYVYDRPMNPGTPSVPATNVLGRLAKAISPTSTASFSYDGLGRMNAQVFTDTSVNPPQVYVERHTYRGDGARVSLDLLLPDANHRIEQVTYSYDSAGRADSAIYTDGTITQNLFSARNTGNIDVFGRVRQAQFGSAVFTADFAETGRRMLNNVKVTAPSGASREIAYPAPAGQVTAFDPLGRERARREIVNGTGPTDQAFQYDLVGQLTNITRTPASTALPNMSFTYDALGNVNVLNAATGSSSARLSYQTVDRDRICSIAYGGGTPGNTCDVKYDGVGNVVEQPSRSNGLRRFSYFANGLVKRVTDGNGNDARFRYDAFGALQQLDLTSNTSSDTRKDRHFGGVISQREEIVGGVRKTVTLRTLPAPGLTATRHGGGSADPWTFTFGESRGNRFFTNQAGEFVQDVDYQGFGEAKSTGAQPGSPSYSNEQFNQGDALAAFGLSRLGARLYDPVIGRFLSRDPLIIPRTAATTNPYAFANNDPVNLSDPSGLSISTGVKGCDSELCKAMQEQMEKTLGIGGSGGGGGGGGGGRGGGTTGTQTPPTPPPPPPPPNKPWDFGSDGYPPTGGGGGGRGDDGPRIPHGGGGRTTTGGGGGGGGSGGGDGGNNGGGGAPSRPLPLFASPLEYSEQSGQVERKAGNGGAVVEYTHLEGKLERDLVGPVKAQFKAGVGKAAFKVSPTGVGGEAKLWELSAGVAAGPVEAKLAAGLGFELNMGNGGKIKLQLIMGVGGSIEVDLDAILIAYQENQRQGLRDAYEAKYNAFRNTIPAAVPDESAVRRTYDIVVQKAPADFILTVPRIR